MAESITLQFESDRVLGALHGNDLKLLARFEEALGLKATAREGRLRLEGEPAALDKGRRVFEQLDRARQNGVSIHRQEFLYALRAATEPASVGLDELSNTRIQTGRRAGVVPKNTSQRDYLAAIETRDLVFGIGPAGTGKTYLAMAMAVQALKSERVARIIITRPAVEAGEELGFLPGDLREKIMPYLRPLYDALHDMLDASEIERMTERGAIEIAPLAYMRGRTLSRAFIVLDEAQNTTTEQMFMCLTRLGPDSKCVVTGDPTQIDLPRNKRSGLLEAMAVLPEIPGIAFCRFHDADVVRHELVQHIVRAYRAHRGDAQNAK